MPVETIRASRIEVGGMPWRYILAFCIAAALGYLAILTNGTFSLEGRETFGEAYDAYARSILDGRVDVPSEVIGKEGFYLDGKVYLYYGVLPAILRLPFLLSGLEPPGSRFFLIMAAVSAAFLFHLVLQYVVNAARSQSMRSEDLATTIFCGVIAWFISPTFILVANASIYSEPVGLALALCAAALFLLRRHIVQAFSGTLPQVGAGRLAVIALLAALAIHARPTLALMLIFICVFLCLMTYFDEPTDSFGSRAFRVIAKGLVPGFLIGTSVAVFLWLNWLKFGDPLKSGPFVYYGYYLYEEGNSPRFQTFFELGRFTLLRAPSNLLEYLFGIGLLHGKLNTLLGVGTSRIGPPETRLIFTQFAMLLYAGLGVRWLYGRFRGKLLPSIWFAGLVVAAGISAILILSYATIATRYGFELWPLILLLALAGLFSNLHNSGASPWLWRRDGSIIPSGRMMAIIAMGVAVSGISIAAMKANPFFNGNPTMREYLTEKQLNNFLAGSHDGEIEHSTDQ